MSAEGVASEFEPLEPPLDDAVRAVLAEPLSADAVARVHERAMNLDAPQEIVHRPRSRARRGRMFAAYAAAGLAALVLVAVVLTMSSHDAWARVADTLRGKAWVRLTLKVPPGTKIPGDLSLPETWFSAKQRTGARTFRKAAGFVDFAHQETWQYDPQKDTISVTSTRESVNADFGFLGLLLTLISPGEAAYELPPTTVEIVERDRREVADGDRRWVEFTFACRDARRKPADFRVTFRVDPQTNLPFEMTSTEKLAPGDPATERTYVVDYPESGPADIYALGVPRTAKVVDRRRKPTADEPQLQELFAAYDEVRKEPMESYKAVVMMTLPGKTDVLSAYRVRLDAEGLQVSAVDHDRLLALRQEVWSGKIVVPQDAEAWWKDQILKLPLGLPGGSDLVVPHEASYPKMTGGSGLEAYVPDLKSPDVTVSLDKQPQIGPAGTVLVRVRVETSSGFNDAAYWIAPDRGYQVLRSELRSKKERTDWDIYATVVDEVAQSPGGRWYATKARLGYVRQSGDELPERAGEDGVSTSVYRYYVDFQ